MPPERALTVVLVLSAKPTWPKKKKKKKKKTKQEEELKCFTVVNYHSTLDKGIK